MMNPIVGFTSLLGQRPGRDRIEITVEIGAPYRYEDDPEEWACPVAVRPLFKRLRAAHGADSLQALCLAISLALDLLRSFEEKGGKLFDDAGEAFPLSSYSLGAKAVSDRNPKKPT